MASLIELNNGPRHVAGIDGLRGAAVMLVICYHFGLLRFGWTGVGLFFVLSGYLITDILLETRNLSLGKFLGRFYWRRTLRILPLYLGVLLCIGIVFLKTGYPSGTQEQFPWLASMTYNLYMAFGHRVGLQQTFHHLWSISTEEQFYLLWPIVVWLMGRKGILVLSIGMILLAPLIRWGEPHIWATATPGKLVYYLPFGHVDGFAWGALLAVAKLAPWRSKAAWCGVAMNLPLMTIIAVTVIRYLMGLIVEWPIHLGFPMASVEGGFHVWGYSAVYLGFAGWLIWVLFGRKGNWIKQLAEWGPSRFVGTISYGMYVFHWLLLLGFEKVWELSENLLIRILQFKLYMILLVVVSWSSHRWFEAYFIRQKERLFPTG